MNSFYVACKTIIWYVYVDRQRAIQIERLMLESEFAPCRLIQYEDGLFGLLFTDFDPADSVFEAMDILNNGYSWESLIESKINVRLPEYAASLEFDSEADMVVVRAADRDLLNKIADLIRSLLTDSTLLREALSRMEPD